MAKKKGGRGRKPPDPLENPLPPIFPPTLQRSRTINELVGTMAKTPLPFARAGSKSGCRGRSGGSRSAALGFGRNGLQLETESPYRRIFATTRQGPRHPEILRRA